MLAFLAGRVGVSAHPVAPGRQQLVGHQQAVGSLGQRAGAQRRDVELQQADVLGVVGQIALGLQPRQHAVARAAARFLSPDEGVTRHHHDQQQRVFDVAVVVEVQPLAQARRAAPFGQHGVQAIAAARLARAFLVTALLAFQFITAGGHERVFPQPRFDFQFGADQGLRTVFLGRTQQVEGARHQQRAGDQRGHHRHAGPGKLEGVLVGHRETSGALQLTLPVAGQPQQRITIVRAAASVETTLQPGE